MTDFSEVDEEIFLNSLTKFMAASAVFMESVTEKARTNPQTKCSSEEEKQRRIQDIQLKITNKERQIGAIMTTEEKRTLMNVVMAGILDNQEAEQNLDSRMIDNQFIPSMEYSQEEPAAAPRTPVSYQPPAGYPNISGIPMAPMRQRPITPGSANRAFPRMPNYSTPMPTTPVSRFSPQETSRAQLLRQRQQQLQMQQQQMRQPTQVQTAELERREFGQQKSILVRQMNQIIAQMSQGGGAVQPEQIMLLRRLNQLIQQEQSPTGSSLVRKLFNAQPRSNCSC